MIVMPALIMITLSMTGIAVAHWADEVYVEGTIKTGSLTLAFDRYEPPICIEICEEYPGGPLVPGELCGENVGETTCHCQGVITDPHTGEWGYENIIVNIENAYPSYRVHCVFVIHNIGQIPADICEFIVTDPTGVLTWNPSLSALVDYGGVPVIHIWSTNLVGGQIDPCNKEKAEFELHIAQGAEECHTYCFKIEIVYDQWGYQ